jgi:hypothetical protein
VKGREKVKEKEKEKNYYYYYYYNNTGRKETARKAR